MYIALEMVPTGRPKVLFNIFISLLITANHIGSYHLATAKPNSTNNASVPDNNTTVPNNKQLNNATSQPNIQAQNTSSVSNDAASGNDNKTTGGKREIQSTHETNIEHPAKVTMISKAEFKLGEMHTIPGKETGNSEVIQQDKKSKFTVVVELLTNLTNGAPQNVSQAIKHVIGEIKAGKLNVTVDEKNATLANIAEMLEANKKASKIKGHNFIEDIEDVLAFINKKNNPIANNSKRQVGAEPRFLSFTARSPSTQNPHNHVQQYRGANATTVIVLYPSSSTKKPAGQGMASSMELQQGGSNNLELDSPWNHNAGDKQVSATIPTHQNLVRFVEWLLRSENRHLIGRPEIRDHVEVLIKKENGPSSDNDLKVQGFKLISSALSSLSNSDEKVDLDVVIKLLEQCVANKPNIDQDIKQLLIKLGQHGLKENLNIENQPKTSPDIENYVKIIMALQNGKDLNELQRPSGSTSTEFYSNSYTVSPPFQLANDDSSNDRIPQFYDLKELIDWLSKDGNQKYENHPKVLHMINDIMEHISTIKNPEGNPVENAPGGREETSTQFNIDGVNDWLQNSRNRNPITTQNPTSGDVDIGQLIKTLQGQGNYQSGKSEYGTHPYNVFDLNLHGNGHQPQEPASQCGLLLAALKNLANRGEIFATPSPNDKTKYEIITILRPWESKCNDYCVEKCKKQKPISDLFKVKIPNPFKYLYDKLRWTTTARPIYRPTTRPIYRPTARPKPKSNDGWLKNILKELTTPPTSTKKPIYYDEPDKRKTTTAQPTRPTNSIFDFLTVRPTTSTTTTTTRPTMVITKITTTKPNVQNNLFVDYLKKVVTPRPKLWPQRVTTIRPETTTSPKETGVFFDYLKSFFTEKPIVQIKPTIIYKPKLTTPNVQSNLFTKYVNNLMTRKPTTSRRPPIQIMAETTTAPTTQKFTGFFKTMFTHAPITRRPVTMSSVSQPQVNLCPPSITTNNCLEVFRFPDVIINPQPQINFLCSQTGQTANLNPCNPLANPCSPQQQVVNLPPNHNMHPITLNVLPNQPNKNVYASPMQNSGQPVMLQVNRMQMCLYEYLRQQPTVSPNAIQCKQIQASSNANRQPQDESYWEFIAKLFDKYLVDRGERAQIQNNMHMECTFSPPACARNYCCSDNNCQYAFTVPQVPNFPNQNQNTFHPSVSNPLVQHVGTIVKKSNLDCNTLNRNNRQDSPIKQTLPIAERSSSDQHPAHTQNEQTNSAKRQAEGNLNTADNSETKNGEVIINGVKTFVGNLLKFVKETKDETTTVGVKDASAKNVEDSTPSERVVEVTENPTQATITTTPATVQQTETTTEKVKVPNGSMITNTPKN